MGDVRLDHLLLLNQAQDQSAIPTSQHAVVLGSDSTMANQEKLSGTLREMLKTSINAPKSTTRTNTNVLRNQRPVPETRNSPTPSKENATSKDRRPNNDPILPPCKVCGAKASGIHFGAVTCEACKVFFRRSMVRKASYHCKNGGNCEMLPMRRITCSFCRLKKCTQLGMSRDGIQRGRYTVEKKTECIKKAKEFELIHQKRKQGEDVAAAPQIIGRDSQGIVRINSEIDNLTKEVVRVDADHIMISDEELEKILQIQTNFLNDRKMSESLFGPTETLPLEEHFIMYRTTGIDLGNWRGQFATCMLNFAQNIKTFISYVKSLPGFLDLPQTDQITLSKESAMDWVILSGYGMFNSEAKVFTCCTCYQTWPAEVMKNSRFSEQGYLATGIMKKLNLYKDELAILKALAVFNPDGSEGQIQGVATVKKIQHDLTECLWATLRKNRNLDDSKLAVLFGQIVHALTEIKDASVSFKHLIDKSVELFPDVDFPELLVEMFSDMLKFHDARQNLTSKLQEFPVNLSMPMPETYIPSSTADMTSGFSALLSGDVHLHQGLPQDVLSLIPEVPDAANNPIINPIVNPVSDSDPIIDPVTETTIDSSTTYSPVSSLSDIDESVSPKFNVLH